MPSLFHRCTAEAFGTFWLVFGGVGSAVLAAGFPEHGIHFVGVSLAFGLTVMTMAYAIGHISGCHLNPAVSVGLLLGKRFEAKDLLPYILAQCVGGTIGAGVLWFIASGTPTFVAGRFGSNGFGAVGSPGGYSAAACFTAEAVLTFFFLLIILGSTDQRAAKGFAPIAIGLGLTLIHLISIPVTNTSVNPARSLSTAIFAGKFWMGQVWMFWVAPIVGAAVAGIFYNAVLAEHEVPPVKEEPVTFAAAS